MNFPRTCRVLVIDDISAEAEPVIEALGKVFVGCIYLKGDNVDDLPAKPLSGVRLVILDMRLGAQNGEAAAAAKMTATVLSRVISPSDGPVAVLLWTKHPDDVTEFRNALFTIDPKFRSMLLIGNLEKPVAPDAGEAKRVVGRLKKMAKSLAPMNVVWHWEQLTHEAAGATSALISEQVADTAGIDPGDDDPIRWKKWVKRLRAVLRELATAAGGRAGTAKSAHADLLETLLALHGDRVERAMVNSEKIDLGDLFVDPRVSISTEHAAKLNSMLLVAPPAGEPGELRPGNAYFQKRGANRNVLFSRTGFKARLVTEDVLGRLSKDEEYRKQEQASKPAKDAQPTQANRDAEKLRKRRLSELCGECIPMLVELSPTCDFSQNKRCVVRFAGGVLVPSALIKLVDDKKESLRVLPHAVNIPGKNGDWFAVFSGRFHFSVAVSKKFAETKPDFRFRSQVLGDVRNWYSAQSARLGYLSV